MAGEARICGSCGRPNPAEQRFCGWCGSVLGATARLEERRWTTVLFADLSGFTSASEHMDPEDVRALVDRAVTRMAEIVVRFGGWVNRVMGDAILAVFGAPVAHEDDAERAVRAALTMQQTVAEHHEDFGGLLLRIGVNTGEVMFATVGPDPARDLTVMGDVVNTASRLQTAAQPGQVLVGDETWRAARRAIRFEQGGRVSVKGKELPVVVWTAMAASPVHAARPLGTAPLLGRDRELDLLGRVWSGVVTGPHPQLVAVLGDAGVGKSRLIAEFEQRVLGGGALVLRGRCLPYGEALSYWALAMVLGEAAGIGADDPAEAARRKLERLTAELVDDSEDAVELVRHLTVLTGLDRPADRVARPVAQGQVHASVRRFLEAFARRRPLCVLLEDLHWADQSLLDLIEFVAARSSLVPLLILTEARPELLEKRPGWGEGLSHAVSLRLEVLAPEAAERLAAILCDQRRLPAQLVEVISHAAEGNPLFLEELAAAMAERQAAVLASVDVPSSIKPLIAGRLDALPAAERQTLQLAGVLGTVFWEGGVRALGASTPVDRNLAALERKSLIRSVSPSEFSGDRQFAFKHGLIRDVAYEMLPKATRRTLHGRAADWMEQAAGSRAETYLDTLAHHCVQAAQWPRALDYLMRAAERARLAAAHRNEAGLLAEAIMVAERAGRRMLVGGLRADRGRALSRVGLWAQARPELETALTELPADQAARRAGALVDLAEACFWLLDTASLRRYAADGLALAGRLGRRDLAAGAMASLAQAEQADGDLVATVTTFERAIGQAGGFTIAPLAGAPLASYLLGDTKRAVELGRQAAQAAATANDTNFTMWALSHLGLALAADGRYREAEATFATARRFGEEFAVGPLLARSICMSAGFHADVYDYADAEALAEEARAAAASLRFAPTVLSAGIDLLLIATRRGDIGQAEALVAGIGEGIESTPSWHEWLWRLRFAQARAELALGHGDHEAALRHATDALERSRRSGRRKYQADALATTGRALAASGHRAEALAALRAALAVARQVDDPALLLRTGIHVLEVEGTDELATPLDAIVERIHAGLDGRMRQAFDRSQSIVTFSLLPHRAPPAGQDPRG